MPTGPGGTLPIGPGRLVVVIGPSGAGKDTLLRLARDDFADDRNVMFPRRIVTREPSPAEENQTISEAAFAAAVAAGRFAFWWEAHGLKYALAAAIDDHIRSGKTVVCNVSRGVIAELRHRYADVRVVLVTAPPDVLAERLAARGRATDGSIAARLDRGAPMDGELAPDVVIENLGAPEDGAEQLVAAIVQRRT
jgi:ribose 1,5-bisphosphokinase